MKPTALLLFAAAAAVSLAVAAPARLPHTAAAVAPQPDPKDAEPLPPAPKAYPDSRHIENPNVKGLILEVYPDKKTKRVLIASEVCLREGNLEVFLCKKNTKEHEAIVRADFDARMIHELLLLAGADAGKPTQFINPKTMEAEYKPATGTKIRVWVHYRKDGKLHTHPAHEWIWNKTKKRPLEHDWVFAGSVLIKDPEDPKAPPFYAANSGELISISNFPFSMLEIPVEISKDDDSLLYEAKTDRIPPLFSKVWVILEPIK
jgi:hypothetical protein